MPNSLHSCGFSTPFSTSPHCAAFGIGNPDAGDREAPLGVPRGVLVGAACSADCEMKPRPRHSKYGRSSNTSASARSAGRLPSHGTTRAVLVLDLGAPVAQLPQDHHDGLQQVERLEPGDDDRLAVVARDELVGAGSR